MCKHKKLLILGVIFLCIAVLLFAFDVIRFPASYPEDFSIRYEAWISSERTNILDTEEGFIQKDLVLDGTATASFSPDPALLRVIWKEVRRNRLTSINGYVEGAQREPSQQYRITLTMNGKTYTVNGRDPAGSAKRDAARLLRFTQYMNELIENLPEYQALPKARGGYL